MSDHDTTELQRRTLLQMVAGLATATGATSLVAGPTKAVPPVPTGKPGDFDFLSGEWRINNRRLKDGGWDLFDGEATVVGILLGPALLAVTGPSDNLSRPQIKPRSQNASTPAGRPAFERAILNFEGQERVVSAS